MACPARDDFSIINSKGLSYAQMNTRNAAKMMACQQQNITVDKPARQASSEDIGEILQHMVAREELTLPDTIRINEQPEVQWYMRPYLIDFLVEAHAASALLPESLFLTINLLDRYSSKMVIQQQYYQLVGCTALLIAAKYVEGVVQASQISELKNKFLSLYSLKKLNLMERHVLNTLEWTTGHPTADCYIQLKVAKEHDDAELKHMSVYLCAIALYHRDFVSIRPSRMARVSIALAQAILGRREVHDDTWAEPESITYVALSQHLVHVSPTLANEYASAKFSCVSRKLIEYIEFAAKPSTNDSTSRRGSASVRGFDDRFTPPRTPESAHDFQVLSPSRLWCVTLTHSSTQPATWLGTMETLRDYQRSTCTMNDHSPRILSAHEVMERQDLISMVDPCSDGCDYKLQTNVWSCPNNGDLYPVCWFQEGREEADWLSKEHFEEMIQRYTPDIGPH